MYVDREANVDNENKSKKRCGIVNFHEGNRRQNGEQMENY